LILKKIHIKECIY